VTSPAHPPTPAHNAAVLLGSLMQAVVDYYRVDWRDLAWQAGLLSYAIGTICGDVSGPFQTAASLGEGETAVLLASMAGAPAACLSRGIPGDPHCGRHRADRG
jgi:hypothetical protein